MADVENPDDPDGSGKKVQRRACWPCAQAKRCCEEVRPCRRCIDSGREHMCVEAPDRRTKAAKAAAVLTMASRGPTKRQREASAAAGSSANAAKLSTLAAATQRRSDREGATGGSPAPAGVGRGGGSGSATSASDGGYGSGAGEYDGEGGHGGPGDYFAELYAPPAAASGAGGGLPQRGLSVGSGEAPREDRSPRGSSGSGGGGGARGDFGGSSSDGGSDEAALRCEVMADLMRGGYPGAGNGRATAAAAATGEEVGAARRRRVNAPAVPAASSMADVRPSGHANAVSGGDAEQELERLVTSGLERSPVPILRVTFPQGTAAPKSAFANAAWCGLFGIPPATLSAMTYRGALPKQVHPADLEAYSTASLEALVAQRPHHVAEARFIGAAGRVFAAREMCSIEYCPSSGAIRTITCYYTDLDEAASDGNGNGQRGTQGQGQEGEEAAGEKREAPARRRWATHDPSHSGVQHTPRRDGGHDDDSYGGGGAGHSSSTGGSSRNSDGSRGGFSSSSSGGAGSGRGGSTSDPGAGSGGSRGGGAYDSLGAPSQRGGGAPSRGRGPHGCLHGPHHPLAHQAGLTFAIRSALTRITASTPAAAPALAPAASLPFVPVGHSSSSRGITLAFSGPFTAGVEAALAAREVAAATAAADASAHGPAGGAAPGPLTLHSVESALAGLRPYLLAEGGRGRSRAPSSTRTETVAGQSAAVSGSVASLSWPPTLPFLPLSQAPSAPSSASSSASAAVGLLAFRPSALFPNTFAETFGLPAAASGAATRKPGASSSLLPPMALSGVPVAALGGAYGGDGSGGGPLKKQKTSGGAYSPVAPHPSYSSVTPPLPALYGGFEVTAALLPIDDDAFGSDDRDGAETASNGSGAGGLPLFHASISSSSSSSGSASSVDLSIGTGSLSSAPPSPTLAAAQSGSRLLPIVHLASHPVPSRPSGVAAGAGALVKAPPPFLRGGSFRSMFGTPAPPSAKAPGLPWALEGALQPMPVPVPVCVDSFLS